MRLLWITLFLALAPQPMCGQGAGNLDDTLKFVQDTLNRQGQVKWTQGPRNKPAEFIEVTTELSDAVADSNACALSFKLDSRYPEYRIAFSLKLPIREIARITVESVEAAAERFRAESKGPPWGSTTTPQVFNLQIYAAEGRKFQAHRRSVNKDQEVIEKDQQQSSIPIIFKDEESAQRIAKALLHARELCGAVKAP